LLGFIIGAFSFLYSGVMDLIDVIYIRGFINVLGSSIANVDLRLPLEAYPLDSHAVFPWWITEAWMVVAANLAILIVVLRDVDMCARLFRVKWS
jgi:hypothetical protein